MVSKQFQVMTDLTMTVQRIYVITQTSQALIHVRQLYKLSTYSFHRCSRMLFAVFIVLRIARFIYLYIYKHERSKVSENHGVGTVLK